MIELGISTFGETTEIEGTGITPTHDERIRELVEEMKLADEVGLDIYAIGEHHRKDFAVSSPEIVLAAGAAVTKNIRLSSAVTVLSSADPIRVYQQYATIDAISKGRSEIMVGRGSFTESTVKIAQKGLPIAYAIVGGKYESFKGLIEYYRKIGIASGHTKKQLKVASHSWGFIAEKDEEAIQKYFHPTKQVVDAISKDRPFWQPLTFEQYLSSVSLEGAMLVGSPETVANKLIKMIEVLGLDRFMLHLPLGSMQYEDVLKAIELFGREVVPRVREYFKNQTRE